MQPPVHTCLQGPLCYQAERYFDQREEGIPQCSHNSCMDIVYVPCRECDAEAMEEYERNCRTYKINLSFLQRGLCPVDMTELTFRAVVAAPGYGHSYDCRCNHYWLHARGAWFSEADLREYVPELTVWDVI